MAIPGRIDLAGTDSAGAFCFAAAALTNAESFPVGVALPLSAGMIAVTNSGANKIASIRRIRYRHERSLGWDAIRIASSLTMFGEGLRQSRRIRFLLGWKYNPVRLRSQCSS